MNQYCKARIVYTMGQEVTVDAELISGWLTCDGDMNVSLNEEAVGDWVNSFAEQSDTLGKARSITSPSGKTAEVSGGTYGWVIDTAAETAAPDRKYKKGRECIEGTCLQAEGSIPVCPGLGRYLCGSGSYGTAYVVCKRRFSTA